jgi:hypothetical protein|tara:strand:- start:234 stop:665 length:432 start_codon:yes stop_codon:yes gene_type:complete
MNKQKLLVKLVNGAELIGRVEDEDPNWIRIDEPLELRTVTKETQYGPRDDSSLAPWIMFANQKSFAIPRDKVLTITSISKELDSYYDVILRQIAKRKLKVPMSPEEMERILMLAERMEQEEQVKEMDEKDVELYNIPTRKTIH